MPNPSRSGAGSLFPRSLELMLQGIIEGERQMAMGHGMNAMLVDIYESADFMVIEIELPGCGCDNIKVSLMGNEVTIEAEKHHDLPKAEHPGQKASFLRLERKFGKFVRTVDLPAPCNTQKAKASIRNGLLTVKLPLVKDRRGKRVYIPVGTE